MNSQLKLLLPKDTWLQWTGGIASMMMMLVIGLTLGWASPYLAQFAAGDAPFPATTSEVSWMASTYHLGRLPGAILGAVFVQYFGTKTTMVIDGFGLLISWILILTGNSAVWICASRFICGASIELANVCFPLYLADISKSTIRGALVTLAGNGLILGILLGNAMGPYLSMTLFAYISLVPNVIFLVILILLPHTPCYLLSKGKTKEAEMSIAKYNPKADVQLEVISVREFIATTNSMTVVEWLRELNIPRNRWAILIIITLSVFTQFSGLNVLASYMEIIMTRGMVTVMAPSTVPIIANGAGFIGGSVMMYMTERYGRRKMWVFSSAGLCVSMVALGVHFYLLGEGYDPVNFQWLAIVSVVSFKVICNMGVAIIPAILISEIFSSRIRTVAACICCTSVGILAFLSIYTYQLLIERIDEAYVYLMYAVLMAISLVFGVFFVPEMKGKTLREIQDVMENK